MQERATYIQAGVLKTNLYNVVGGVGIGLVIYLFASVARGQFADGSTLFRNILFSVCISAGVSNGILLAQSVFKLSCERMWVFILVYYSSSLLGMVVGVEAGFFLLSVATGAPFSLFHVEIYLFSALIVVIICTVLFAYQAQKVDLDNRVRQKELDLAKLTQLKSQAELATLHARINPHFLYNSLNSIASLIHIDPDKAESMTLKLSKLFRYSINHNQEDMVLVKDEIETCNTYLDIEKVRFGDRITFRLDVDEDLLEAKIPRFLIQPLVENALKHGLNNTPRDGELVIAIKKRGQQIEISVADNGRPFPADLQIGYGLESTYDKLHLLYSDKYQVQLGNEPIKQIKITIPLTA